MASNSSSGEVDILIVGAGPAGATAALNLAPIHAVALIDQRSNPETRIGESLPPAARRLLTDMGLWQAFLAEGHFPCYANRAVWGSPEPIDTDFLRNPDGNGWHIDRARVETWLRGVAVYAGATLLAPAQLQSIDSDGGRWRVQLLSRDSCDSGVSIPPFANARRSGPPRGVVELTAKVVIDAGGRAAPVGRRLGAHRTREDKLVSAWLYGKTPAQQRCAGFTYVEAVEDGWWYSSPVPGDRRVIAFHTDSDLPSASMIVTPKTLLERAAAPAGLAELLSDCGFTPAEQFGVTAAHSGVLQPFAGPGWFAIGDAAVSFDPLSSQGLFNALFTGLAAAEAADRYLSGADGAVSEYIETLDRIHACYWQQLVHYYRAESRWCDAPFWKRRQHAFPPGRGSPSTVHRIN